MTTAPEFSWTTWIASAPLPDPKNLETESHNYSNQASKEDPLVAHEWQHIVFIGFAALIIVGLVVLRLISRKTDDVVIFALILSAALICLILFTGVV
jgi:heme A synthase